MANYLCDFCVYLRRRIYLISWISLVIYIFYKSFVYYLNGRQFYYLRHMLGLGLCISRGTATVLNLCCALVLLPLCKKLNLFLYRILSKLCPGLFFFWLEKTKSFHMTVAITLVLFGVIHSVSHFVNLWNFSRSYDADRQEINLARYKNESPFLLLISVAGVTGVSMLLIVLSMGLTSTRIVRRKVYNAFWYTHQLYLPFMVLLMIHPLSGVLKEEVVNENESARIPSKAENTSAPDVTSPKFVAIKSMTWLWMALPLSCFCVDLLWRVFSRNLARVQILNVNHMAGRTISLTMSIPHSQFTCRTGQYVLMQCLETSIMEWHPFTVVKVPTTDQREFVIWVKVKGDWTESLEKVIKEIGPNNLSVLIDGPFSSPMEGIGTRDIAICVAAGVGITPFVSVLTEMLLNPRGRLPGRLHLIWIVRTEDELLWIAKLANDTIIQLRNANRPDRLHIELYVTNSNYNGANCKDNNKQNAITHVVVSEKGDLKHVVDRNDEKDTLLTPKRKRISFIANKNTIDNNKYNANNYKQSNTTNIISNNMDLNHTIERNEEVMALKNGIGIDENKSINKRNSIEIARKYPVIGCRVRRGRPHWDRVFGYWVHLYPGHRLNLYCCGPKKLVKLLRSKCKHTSRFTKTKLTFIHEAFS